MIASSILCVIQFASNNKLDFYLFGSWFASGNDFEKLYNTYQRRNPIWRRTHINLNSVWFFMHNAFVFGIKFLHSTWQIFYTSHEIPIAPILVVLFKTHLHDKENYNELCIKNWFYLWYQNPYVEFIVLQVICSI